MVTYGSRSLSEAERKYSFTERECVAVIWVIEKFRAYLEGYHITVITDHSSPKWLHNLRNPTGRLTRWALSLLEYDFEIVHRRGSMHQVPDALSRLYETRMETINLITDGKTSWYVRWFLAVGQFPEKFSSWRIEGGQLYSYRPDSHVSNLDSDLSKGKLVPSDEQHLIVLSEAHSNPQSGYLGAQKTYMRISRDYFCPGCFKDVVAYFGRCAICQTCKVD